MCFHVIASHAELLTTCLCVCVCVWQVYADTADEGVAELVGLAGGVSVSQPTVATVWLGAAKETPSARQTAVSSNWVPVLEGPLRWPSCVCAGVTLSNIPTISCHVVSAHTGVAWSIVHTMCCCLAM